MDLSAPISYNGITTGLTPQPGGKPSVGVEITRVRYGDVMGDGFLDRRAVQDGLDASDVYLSGRSVFIDAAVYGSSDGDLWDRVQDFNAAFSPTLALAADTANLGFLPFDFYQATADTSTWSPGSFPNGIPLRLYLRPLRAPAFTIEKAGTGGGGVSGQGGKQLLTVPLIARDPRKYLQTQQTVNVLAAASGTASYRGDYPSFPILTFSLSASGHSAFTFTLHTDALAINLSSLSSGTYTIDYGKQTFVDQNGNSKLALITDPTGFPQIKFGATGWNRSNTTGLSAITLTYREAFA